MFTVQRNTDAAIQLEKEKLRSALILKATEAGSREENQQLSARARRIVVNVSGTTRVQVTVSTAKGFLLTGVEPKRSYPLETIRFNGLESDYQVPGTG